ncbi:hypothetical protein I3843_01G273600 [Carya illinoinensis]|uniref:DUF674 domain-containing protein n=1 Tax=Carya illinoinensis TaxID=32201 RepID=A0A8T1RTE3_CARIL|nr:uncharacterized protein LOC122290258 [Carya illinoinensis]KAG2730144.1 hypothetical protein I3760_01G279100 [Carya illinoinensis]KAG6670019.1 hypothetical protein CIPAW_01G282100 [Carya illinoinensis]KAG6734709.1 hypothetical protein I3842_01G283800 [Carya illinoinensis]KAG7998804.1 hypothetical protein I3843_01G273600 [Carya illinoinensis]
MATTKVGLKLIIDKKKQRLIFAEADKKCVDFLFSILTLPVGTVAELLKEEGMVGCLPSLHNSVKNLSAPCFLNDKSKDFLLNPKVVAPGANVSLLLPNDEPFTYRKLTSQSVHGNNCSGYRIEDDNPINGCGGHTAEGGYIKGMVTYMVMDDLEVKPMTTIAGITLLKEFNLEEVGAVEEKVVELGMDEGVKLLKASLQSKTVLTDLFLSCPDN